MRWSLTDPVGPAGMARAIQNESPLCQDEGWGVQARQFRPVAGRRRVGRSVVAGPGVTEQPAAPPTQAAIPSSWPCRPVSRSSPLPSAHLTADHQTGRTVRSTVPRPARRAAASRLLADGNGNGDAGGAVDGVQDFRRAPRTGAGRAETVPSASASPLGRPSSRRSRRIGATGGASRRASSAHGEHPASTRMRPT